MRYARTSQFREDVEGLPNEVKRKIPKAFDLFKQDPHHPSLQTNKIRGAMTRNGEAIWVGRVDQSHRFTFHYRKEKDEDGETVIVFRRVGPHSVIDIDRE